MVVSGLTCGYRTVPPSIATGPTFGRCYSLWNGRSVELIWVKFTVRAHTPRAPDRLVPIVAEECAEPRDSAQNIDRDPPRLVPREQLVSVVHTAEPCVFHERE